MYWNYETNGSYTSTVYRLIETWDVLKSVSYPKGNAPHQWLIETWDVLKFWNWLQGFSSD